MISLLSRYSPHAEQNSNHNLSDHQRIASRPKLSGVQTHAAANAAGANCNTDKVGDAKMVPPHVRQRGWNAYPQIGEKHHAFRGYADRTRPGNWDAKRVQAALVAHWEDAGHLDRLPEYKAEYARTGHVRVPSFYPPRMHREALTALVRTLENSGQQRTKPNPYSGTARKFTSVSTQDLVREASIINCLYRSPAMLKFNSIIFGAAVRPLGRKFKTDEHPAHAMRGNGQTLGTHLDLADHTKVDIYRGAPAGAGAGVQFLRPPLELLNEHGLVDLDRVAGTLDEFAHLVKTEYPQSNSAYYLNTAKFPHRVLPLLRDIDKPRVNVTNSYAARAGDTRPQAYINELYEREVKTAFPALHPESGHTI